MKNTNAIKLLQTLSKKEFKEFEAFINSPMQLKKRDVTGYFKAIKKFYPDFDSTSFTDEKVYRVMFPKEKFDKAKYSLAAYYLFDSLCEFLVFLNNRENNIERSLSLMNQLLQRGMGNAFEKLAKKLDKEIEANKLTLDSYFFYKYRYNDLLMTYNTRMNDFEGQFGSFIRKTDDSIGLYILRYLRSIPNVIFAEKYYKIKMETNLINKVVSTSDMDKLFSYEKDHPYLKILEVIYYIYKGNSDEKSDEWLKKAEEAFTKNLDLYDREEQVYIFMHLLNLYNVKVRDTSEYDLKRQYEKEQLEMIKFVVGKDLHWSKKEKYMPMLHFRNIFFLALDVQDFQWAEEFVDTQVDKLKPSYRKNMRNYSMAVLESDRGNYEKSLEYLSVVKYDSFHYKTDVKLLLMIIYYELKLIDQAYYAMDTAKKYLESTTDVNEEDRITNSNFLKYYNRLLKQSEKPDRVEIELCIKKIKGTMGEIEYAEWLLKKFEALL